MGKKKPLPIIKIVVVGSSGVGKYSLAHQFAKGWIAPKEAYGKLVKFVKVGLTLF